MLYGFGLDVPYTAASGQTGTANVDSSRPFAYCGSCYGTQQMLAELGFYQGKVDGQCGDGTKSAMATAIKTLAPSLPVGWTKETCEAVMAAWTAKKAAGAPPTQSAPPPAGGGGAAPVGTRFIRRPGMPTLTLVGRGTVGGGDAAGTGWWASQSTGTKAAIILGGVAVVGGIGYYVYTQKKGQ